MIGNTDAVKVLDSKRGNSVFVATMNANNVGFGLPSISSNDALDFPISGAMSKASSVGLGLALAQPDRKIMVGWRWQPADEPGDSGHSIQQSPQEHVPFPVQ
jgi:hypothetical protein